MEIAIATMASIPVGARTHNDFQSLLLEEFDGGGEQNLICDKSAGVPNVITPPTTPTESPSSSMATDYKVKYNLKEPVIKLHRLPRKVLERRTILVTKDNRIHFPDEEDEEEDDDEYYGSSCPKRTKMTNCPPLSHFVPPSLLLMSPFMLNNSHCSNGANGIYGNPERHQWATSFFLHMNRYNPEESCFASPPASPPPPSRVSPPTPPKSIPPKRLPTSPQEWRKARRHTSHGSRRPPSNKPRPQHYGMNTVNGKAEPWKCEHCPKTFLYKWNLVTHLLMHTGEKPYACQLCVARYRQKTHLVKHIAGHHPHSSANQPTPSPSPVTGIILNPTCSCGFCGDTFPGKPFLERHILNLHKDKLVRKLHTKA